MVVPGFDISPRLIVITTIRYSTSVRLNKMRPCFVLLGLLCTSVSIISAVPPLPALRAILLCIAQPKLNLNPSEQFVYDFYTRVTPQIVSSVLFSTSSQRLLLQEEEEDSQEIG